MSNRVTPDGKLVDVYLSTALCVPAPKHWLMGTCTWALIDESNAPEREEVACVQRIPQPRGGVEPYGRAERTAQTLHLATDETWKGRKGKKETEKT